MTTLKITVINKKNARLLSNILKNMNFVKKNRRRKQDI
jgi:hypothetical protein